jgi:hypothetical protein
MLVPIRYRAAVKHGETLDLDGRVSWLLHLIHASISHHEGKTHIRIRIFGFVLYDNLRPRSPKVKKKVHVTSTSRKKQKRKKVIRENHVDDETKTLTKLKSVEQTKIINESETQVQENTKIENTVSENKEIVIKQEKKYEESYLSSSQHPIIEETHRFKEETKYESKKQSLFERLRIKLKNLRDNITSFYSGIKNKVRSILESVGSIHQKFKLILEFLKDEINKEGFHITFQSIKRLFKHILPTKLQSKIIFGTGDPCSTGQALGFLSILYSFYGDKITIIPDFENSRFEGEHYVRGRIRLVTILIIVIKLILDKRFKQLRRNFQILKEAL